MKPGVAAEAALAVLPPTARVIDDATFRHLFASGPDAVVVVDVDGRIQLANQQSQQLFGYSEAELIGAPIDLLVPQPLRAAHVGHFAAYLKHPIPRRVVIHPEPAGRRKDGSEFPAGIALSSMQTPQGLLVSAAVRDITARQRIERERGQVGARLLEAQRNEERADLAAERDEERADLEAQLQQAQRLEIVGQLAGGVAHDFNNLLAGIMNYAGLVSASLQKEMRGHGLVGEPAFNRLAQDVEEIAKIAERAATLTQQLLIFSRRTVVQPEVLDLNEMLRDLETLLRTTVGESVELRLLFGESLPLVKADRGQIEQVFMNLAVNARDAMPGGGELQIETATVVVGSDRARLQAIAAGPYARLTVSDNGTGMSSEVAARTFDPFFTTKPKGEGSGLGLATVYGIVTEAGGDVIIDSSLGVGTRVRVDLPATPDDETRSREPALDDVFVARGETVLLVEDEAVVRVPVERLLADHGYSVLSAGNAEEALVIFRAHDGPIDLLLTDVVMPGKSGKELSDEVVAARPMIKVLFMSAYSQDVIGHGGVLEDGISLIEKPFPASDLLRRVRRVLDGGG